jgi:hypothetical protein
MVGIEAHLPLAAVNAEKVSVAVVMTGQADDNIHAASRIVNQLHTIYVLMAIAMCRSVRRWPMSFSYSTARCAINAYT